MSQAPPGDWLTITLAAQAGVFYLISRSDIVDQLLTIQLPGTAIEFIAVLSIFVVTAFSNGHVANVVVNAVKQIDLWMQAKTGNGEILTDEQESRIGGLVAEILVLIVTAVMGWLGMHYLTPLAQWLDSVGVWPLILAGFAFARQVYAMRQKAGLK